MPHETVTRPCRCPRCGSLRCREIPDRDPPAPHVRAAAAAGKIALEARAARPGDPLLECAVCLHRWGDAVTRIP